MNIRFSYECVFFSLGYTYIQYFFAFFEVFIGYFLLLYFYSKKIEVNRRFFVGKNYYYLSFFLRSFSFLLLGVTTGVALSAGFFLYLFLLMLSFVNIFPVDDCEVEESILVFLPLFYYFLPFGFALAAITPRFHLPPFF